MMLQSEGEVVAAEGTTGTAKRQSAAVKIRQQRGPYCRGVAGRMTPYQQEKFNFLISQYRTKFGTLHAKQIALSELIEEAQENLLAQLVDWESINVTEYKLDPALSSSRVVKATAELTLLLVHR